MTGMQPGIPDTAWLWAALASAGFGILAALTHLAWTRIRIRRGWRR